MDLSAARAFNEIPLFPMGFRLPVLSLVPPTIPVLRTGIVLASYRLTVAFTSVGSMR